MTLSILKSKIHCATVTEANLHYIGSITIDEDLMEVAGLLPNEHVHVVNNMNGERIETYVIRGERGTGCICLNGAAARKFQPGDEVIIMAYADMSPEEAADFQPKVIFPHENNRLAQ
ncbi:aspartate 1-decarboxylase [Alloprevotella sp. OH1205_COT-284]|uniref:aspartate 1-decarboxylase n=1 Tax=Alloprevotella sp. OH1205_COT-284 TaxID=2491043 RepID=UPI000F5FA540|nr:aspartate 1-decarboxylase [Alloprevotella sp. OH1205_COT-284]RRD79485.1 aspartate 1-decarboxylase [Alloprevotella sp. OH1205_COT-284]